MKRSLLFDPPTFVKVSKCKEYFTPAVANFKIFQFDSLRLTSNLSKNEYFQYLHHIGKIFSDFAAAAANNFLLNGKAFHRYKRTIHSVY